MLTPQATMNFSRQEQLALTVLKTGIFDDYIISQPEISGSFKPPEQEGLPFKSARKCPSGFLPKSPLFLDAYDTILFARAAEHGTHDVKANSSDNASKLRDAIKILTDNCQIPSLTLTTEQYESVIANYFAAIHKEADGDDPSKEFNALRCMQRAFSQVDSPVVRDLDNLIKICLAFEMLRNKVGLMPGIKDALPSLKTNISLGIISNSQFYTDAILRYVFHKEGLDFNSIFTNDLLIYSHRLGTQKPYATIFNVAKSAAKGTSNCMLIGNCLRNDWMGAENNGFKGILCAVDPNKTRVKVAGDNLATCQELSEQNPIIYFTDWKEVPKLFEE